MKHFRCECGQTVFCENTLCGNCGRTLAFDPFSCVMRSLTKEPDGSLADSQGRRFWLWSNWLNYKVCNGVVEDFGNFAHGALCNSCRLNRTIPIIKWRPANLVRWKKLERAKRRMIAGASRLGLKAAVEEGPGPLPPLRFDFLEDKRSHPNVTETFVTTGHKNGLITINVLEADDVQLVRQQELMGERYRTVLGHFRHEAGHYFYPQLITDTAEFTGVFGDPGADYQQAMQHYYDNGPPPNWSENYISAYASSHPLEDWAECFAHYLHIQDTLETAVDQGVTDDPGEAFADKLNAWLELIIPLNEINRSLGLKDPYPFVLKETIIAKLHQVDAAISRAGHQDSSQRQPQGRSSPPLPAQDATS